MIRCLAPFVMIDDHAMKKLHRIADFTCDGVCWVSKNRSAVTAMLLPSSNICSLACFRHRHTHGSAWVRVQFPFIFASNGAEVSKASQAAPRHGHLGFFGVRNSTRRPRY